MSAEASSSRETLPPVVWSAAWRRAAPVLALALLAVLLLYRETAQLMVGVWRNSETYAHAFLVPPISAWLIWRQRHALALAVPRPAWWALAPMAAAVLAWLAGDLVSVNSVTQFALVAMLTLTVPLVLGWPATRTILFPVGFLFFMVPVGEFLLPVLMEGTADFTVFALSASGIPVYREGLQFVIPSGNWSVVEACSGVRYLIASLMVGTLFAYLNYRVMWRRWVFVGVAIVVPIVANWVRAYMIVMLGHLSNNRIAVGVDHLFYGWVFFGIVIMLMFWIGSRWAEADAPLPLAAAGAAGGDGAGAPPAPWAAALAGALLVGAAHAGLWALDRDAKALPRPELTLPAAPGGDWRAVAPSKTPLDWAPSFLNPRALATGAYRGAGGEVGLHIAYFRAQDYGSKLVTSMHQITQADDSTWNRSNPAPLAAGGATWRLTLLQGSPTLSSNSRISKILVARTYWVDGRFTASDIEAKWLSAMSRLAGRGDDGALVMLHAVADDEAEARRRLEAFAQQATGAIGEQLQAVRARR